MIKKSIIISAIILTAICGYKFAAYAESEPIVKVEIPTSTININEPKEPSTASKAFETTKDATKKAAKTTAAKTKSVTNKTVNATKKLTNKTVNGTKELIDDLNPNKMITAEELESKSAVKTLKNERDGLKAAYNSRIKDTEAKIKATEKSTLINDVEKQNKIYTLNKEKKALEIQRDNILKKYDNEIKNKKK